MAGGFHSTSPVWYRVALVARVTSKFPSALKLFPVKPFAFNLSSYLLYRTMSGLQIWSAGTCNMFTPQGIQRLTRRKRFKDFSHLRIPQGSTAACNPAKTVPPKGSSSLSGSSGSTMLT